MGFDHPTKVVLSPIAEKNITDIVKYYKSVSGKAAADFLIELDDAFEAISRTPSFQILFEHYRFFKIRKFPYIIVYKFDSKVNKNFVLILFNTWNDPQKLMDLDVFFD